VPKINDDAINACVSKAQDYSTKFREIGDSFDNSNMDSGALGELPSATALCGAINAMNAAMGKEFDAAFTRLDQVARALDAVLQSTRNTESDNVRIMSV